MATIALLDGSGNKNIIGTKGTLPENFTVPEGNLLSWEHQFQHEVKCPMKPMRIHHKRATVTCEPLLDSLVVRIESPSVPDFLEAIEFVTKFVGGNVGTFDITPNTSSLVSALSNDAKRFWGVAKTGFNSLRQTVGMRIIGK